MLQANEVNNEISCIQSHLVPTETAISSLQPEYQPGVIFSQIFKNPAVVLCPSGWQYKIINEKNPFITYYFAISCIDIDRTFGLLLEKQISFGKDMVMMCKLYNKMFDLEKIGIEIPCLPSVQNITIILQQLNNIHVCIGGPLEHQYPGIHNSMAHVGLNGRWRHKQCPYILDYKIRQKQSCLHCFNISVALRMKRKRMSEGKKSILLLSPSKKEQLNTIRQDKHRIQKKVLRAKFRVKILESELSDAKDELSKIPCNLIEDIIHKHQLNDSQAIMLREVIAVSKYTNPKNRRYSQDWLLLCLLFHIRSSGAYKFLRDQQLLPLPCTTTIRKYISIIKADCGFDDQFFKLLKKRMSKKTDKQRHGVLLLDEVQLRKGVYVNTRNLTYTGLEDMGGEVVSSDNKKADHGLVLMFQSLAEKFSQPIAVFASSGVVSGDLLLFTKYLYKLMILLFYFFRNCPGTACFKGNCVLRKFKLYNRWNNLRWGID